MMKPYAIGIDIGGTTTTLGLVDRRGQILQQSVVATTGHSSLEDYILCLKNEVKQLLGDIDIEQINGIGVGAPNGNFYTGEIVDAANMPWKGRVPLAEILGNATGYKVTLTNDANATAMGEMMYGAAKGMKDFIMITLGTGVGSGIVANGQLIYGHDGFAGELGHTIAIRDGRQCGCGRNGCMERYCSATGIVITAKERLVDYQGKSLLQEGDELTAKRIYDAAVAGDDLAIEVFDYTGKILGETLANAVAMTSPKAIILFGGLAKAGDFILNPVKKYMEENLLNIYQGKIEVIPSALPDADAAILGASALAW